MESDEGNLIESCVVKYVLYREFEKADLIGLHFLDSIQSNHVSQSHLFLPHQAQLSSRMMTQLILKPVTN